MPLFILKRTDAVGWDEYDSYVVRAKNEAEARKITKEDAYESSWAEDKDVTCERLSVRGKSEAILGSFNAG